MNIFNSNRIIIFLLLITNLTYSQSNLKTWTETTVQDFSDNQLTNLVISDDSSTIVSLTHPLVKTTDDYLDNSLLRFIAKDSVGNFVHAWNSENGNIYVKKYSADGSEVTQTIKVNEGVGNIHTSKTRVAILNDGTYIVMWKNSGTSGIYSQIFKNDSVKVGNNFRIDDSIHTFGNGYPIANNVEHCFLILLSVRENYPENRLYVQKRDEYGNKIGEIKKLNQENYTTVEYDSKAVSDKSSFWVSWRGYSKDENFNEYDFGIYLRHFGFDGTPMSDAILVVPHVGSHDLCLDNNSHLLISWEEQTNIIYGGSNILGQLFDSTGVIIGPQIRLNSISPNIYNQEPDVEFINDGFQISWISWLDEPYGYVTYVNKWKFDPKLSGEMISSVFDGSPRGCSFEEISWDYQSYPSSDLKFQIRSAKTLEQLYISQWFGPTSPSDFYTIAAGENINSRHNGDRYIQYKAYFSSEYGNSAELKSISISYIPNDTIPPLPPNSLTSSNDHKHVYLNWQASSDNDVAEYKIYRGLESNKYDEDWNRVIPKGVTSFIDSTALIGKRYYYAITAIDSSHNESIYSNEAMEMFSGLNFYVSVNGSSTGSGSIDDPVKTIQQGMDLALPGDTLKVMPGNYSDKFNHKARVSLVCSSVSKCTLSCEIYPSDDCTVKGFTITKPIHCVKGAPIITENIIKGNGNGYAIYLSADGKNNFSSAIISKNYITRCSVGISTKNYILEPIIKNNIIEAAESGINIMYDGGMEIFNNTITVSANMGFSIRTNRSPCKIENNICVSRNGITLGNEFSSTVNYNDIWGEYPSDFELSSTNVLFDPKFVNEDVSDYHLLAESPCKDAGNPDPGYNDVDGTRNDMGAYGGPDPFDLNIISQLTRSIYVSSLSGYPGDTISVSISLDKPSGLAKADFSLEYDNTILNFINAHLTEATSNFNLEQQVLSSNEIEFSISSTLGAEESSNDILKLNFMVSSQSKANDASQLLLKNVSLVDTLSKPIFIRSLTNGAFVVNNVSESENYIYVDSKNSGTEDGSRKHPFKTIAAGINKAESGDTVLVAGGDYYETLDMKEGASLIGSGSSVTNIIGTGDNYGILFDNVKDGEISGFTFKTDNEHLMMSAFIICNSSSPVIKKNRFETELFENTAVLCENNSSPLIEENYLENSDIFVNTSNPVIRNNFINCFMWGIRCLTNSNVQISGNTITGMLDAIQIYQSSAVIKNNIIYCGVGELGIMLDNAAHTQIYNNIIKDIGTTGKGIRIYESQNTEVINNTIDTKNIGIEEITSVSNIFNNIVVNNLNYGIESSDASQIDYNAFWNNSSNYSGTNPGDHNIMGNVLFADTSKENYRLLLSSPCINAGNPDSQYYDIDGSRNDIGAYGGPYADSSWINYDGSTLVVNQLTERDTIGIVITGDQVRGIAGMNLGLSFDPTVLTVLNASSSDLTRSFSLEKTNIKPGSIKLYMKSNKGITNDNGGLVQLRFAAHSSNPTTTMIHIDSASIWDETTCSKNILSLKDGEINVLTDVNENNEVLPKTYALYQNYPNPFNPSTSIKYQLPVNSNVTLTIYDILGRTVDVLVKEYKKAGTYTVTWNALKFSSGVYIARISTGKFDKSIKLLLLK